MSGMSVSLQDAMSGRFTTVKKWAPRQDIPVEETYLAPLVYMTRSHDDEIRMQAVCAIANLAEGPVRPAVAALRNLQDRSVLVDVFEGTRPPLDLLKRKEAVGGLVNLLRNRKVHPELVNEGLLPVLLRLSKSGVQAEAVAGKMIGAGGLGHALKRTGSGPGIPKPGMERAGAHRRVGPLTTWDYPSLRLIVYGIALLCANETMAPELLAEGFVAELMRILSIHAKLNDLYVRRNATHALTALSFNEAARLEIKRLGGFQLATELLQQNPMETLDLRWQGSMLACNLCMHEANRLDAVRSPMLPTMLQLVLPPPTSGEAEQVALALATLCADKSILPHLPTADVTGSLLALAQIGSLVAKQHAFWALSNLSTTRPTHPSLLSEEALFTLIHAVSAEGAPSRQARRDALTALKWLTVNPEIGPACQRVEGAGSGRLLAVIVKCGMVSDVELCNPALLILARWADNIYYHAELVIGGALPPLILALQHPSEKTEYPHVYGARGLACISIHRYFSRMIREGGSCAPLLELMHSSWPRIRKSACRAVCNLAKDIDGSLELLRIGGMSTALQVTRKARLAKDEVSSDYAAKAVSLMYEAWSLEEENAEKEVRSLLELERAATASKGDLFDADAAAENKRQTVRNRVTFPSHTLKLTVFNAWQLRVSLQGSERKGKMQQMRDRRAVKTIQQRTRERLDKVEGAATTIEKNYRGTKVRKENKEKKEMDKAALKIQARWRGKKARKRPVKSKAQEEIDRKGREMRWSRK